jgi:hypothetical protein
MCGIAGKVSFSNNLREREMILGRMVDSGEGVVSIPCRDQKGDGCPPEHDGKGLDYGDFLIPTRSCDP